MYEDFRDKDMKSKVIKDHNYTCNLKVLMNHESNYKPAVINQTRYIPEHPIEYKNEYINDSIRRHLKFYHKV